jgi:hypothetical protein
LARWIERPFRPQGQDPRAVLLAAMTDFGGSALAARAVAFYDDPRQFEAFLDGLRLEAPWTEHARAPIPAELAFEIFFVLLLENKYLGYIGWDAGADQILEAYDRLFARAGLAKFTDAERQEARRICSRCRQRGDPLLLLFDHLAAAAKARGREIVHLNMGQADQFPALLPPEAYRRWTRWNSPKFGKRFPVIP